MSLEKRFRIIQSYKTKQKNSIYNCHNFIAEDACMQEQSQVRFFEFDLAKKKKEELSLDFCKRYSKVLS